MKSITFAVLDANVLTGIGLQHILKDIAPMVDVRLFTSFESLQTSDQDEFAHCFVASRIYFEHTQYFREHHQRVIVMVAGDMEIHGVPTVNVCQSEQHIVKSLLGLRRMGHPQELAVHHSHSGNKDGHPSGSSGHPVASVCNQMSHTAHDAHLASPDPLPLPTLLSARETEVARLLAKGYINKEVADTLNISLPTVVSHRKNIMDKLHARSLADIIVYSVMNGIVDLGEL